MRKLIALFAMFGALALMPGCGGCGGVVAISIVHGSKIAFETDRDGNFEVYVMNADGTGQTNLTNDAGNDFAPVFN